MHNESIAAKPHKQWLSLLLRLLESTDNNID